MAHLEVKRKKKSAWLLWMLGSIVLIILILMWLRGRNPSLMDAAIATDSTDATHSDSAAPIALTEPNWDNVNFNAPRVEKVDINDPDISIREEGDYTIYSLGENILFAKNQNTLQASSESKLNRIASVLKERFDGDYIRIYGSTDSTGTRPYNDHLGIDRAKVVKMYLTDRGVDNSKISIHSVGEKEPIASNETASGRQQNRNVQIVIYHTK